MCSDKVHESLATFVIVNGYWYMYLTTQNLVNQGSKKGVEVFHLEANPCLLQKDLQVCFWLSILFIGLDLVADFCSLRDVHAVSA